MDTPVLSNLRLINQAVAGEKCSLLLSNEALCFVSQICRPSGVCVSYTMRGCLPKCAHEVDNMKASVTTVIYTSRFAILSCFICRVSRHVTRVNSQRWQALQTSVLRRHADVAWRCQQERFQSMSRAVLNENKAPTVGLPTAWQTVKVGMVSV